VPIQAGSEASHALAEIDSTTDPAQKLALIDKFAANLGQGDMAIIADDLYVNYYIGVKNYEKAFEYGEKLFALDPDNFQNGVNMVRAAQEKGDIGRMFSYGQKTAAILRRYKAAPAPAGLSDNDWQGQKESTLRNAHDNISYVQQLLVTSALAVSEASQRALLLTQFAQMFPDSEFVDRALGVAAASYQQAQNAPKMLEVANALLAKNPDNIAMLLLLADYYSEKGEQLDKAESYARKSIAALQVAKKPEGMTDEQWQQENALQKGVALSALGQVNIQKNDNVQAAENLRAAAPLLKSNAGSYGRNQYRLGFALLNLKKVPEAKVAFGEAASVNSPYKSLAQEKLKRLSGGTRDAGRRKES
jgi:tetratricopeptide (TPR) repeat protein